ncbi:MAG: ferredoxin-type protein NapF [Candidatus Electrothrix sp. AR4]|nr:ferredoxin-type protein NapF [Candidatus Electrothrix sp. AR4]
MNLASLLLDKCLEYLLKEDLDSSCAIEKDEKTVLYPPWSLDEEKFISLCDGCGDCVAACADKLIYLQENALPVVGFSEGHCNFCGECARVCPTGALSFESERPPWRLHVSINTNCLMHKKVLCQICREQCDQGAIVFARDGHSDRPPEIMLEKCNGCGACSQRCPTDAVSFQQIDEQQSNPVPRGD